jgi:hypothetical protein
MIMRMKYAKPWLIREESEVTGQFVHPRGSKYRPHQGQKEMARRRRKMGVTFGQYAAMSDERANEIFTYRV